MGPQTDEILDGSGRRAASTLDLLRGAGLGPVAALAIGGATLIVAIAIGTFIAVMNFRDHALDNSKQQLENSVLLLSRHFEHYLQDFTSVQDALLKEFAPLTALPPQDFARAMASSQTHALLETKLSGMADVVGLHMGTDGALLNSLANGRCASSTSIAILPVMKRFCEATRWRPRERRVSNGRVVS